MGRKHLSNRHQHGDHAERADSSLDWQRAGKPDRDQRRQRLLQRDGERDDSVDYQWRDDGATVSGATNTSYTLAGAWADNAGSYTVVVSNAYGIVTSTVAVLTVNKATPVVTSWPTASGIAYRRPLSASTLSGGSASVGGTFAFTTPSTTPTVGTYCRVRHLHADRHRPTTTPSPAP